MEYLPLRYPPDPVAAALGSDASFHLPLTSDFDISSFSLDFAPVFTVDDHSSFAALLNSDGTPPTAPIPHMSRHVSPLTGTRAAGPNFHFGDAATEFEFGFDWVNAAQLVEDDRLPVPHARSLGSSFNPELSNASSDEPPTSGSSKRKSMGAESSKPPKPPVSTRRKACEPCRAKKLRCDGVRPHCSTCARSPQGPRQCIYYADNPTAAAALIGASGDQNECKEKKRRGGDMKALEDRVNALEAMLATAIAGSSSSSTGSPPPVSEKSPSPQQETGHWSNEPSPHSSPAMQFVGDDSEMEMVSDGPAMDLQSVAAAVAVSKTWFCDIANRLRFLKITQPAAIQHQQQPALPPPPPTDMLPDLHEVVVRYDLLELYFSRRSSFLPFDFLHKETLLRHIHEESPMLLFALYAATCRASSDDLVRNSFPFFYARARKLIPVHVECPTLSGLQGILFLSSASITQGLMSTAWMYLGMACRMAQFIRLDVEPDDLGITNWAEAESRRRTWWCVYTMELIKNTVLSRTPFFRENSGNVKYAVADAIWEAADAIGKLPPQMEGGSYVAWTAKGFRFMDLYSKAVEYNRRALRDGVDFDVVDPALTVLEAEMENWFHTLPSSIRLVESRYVFSPSPASDDPPSFHAVTCYMLYQGAMCLLYRPRMVAAFLSPLKHPMGVKAIAVAQKAANDLGSLAQRLAAPNSISGMDGVASDYGTFLPCMGLFESGIVLIMSSALACVRGEPEVCSAAQQNLFGILKLLRTLGKRLPPCGLMADVIQVINKGVMKGNTCLNSENPEEWMKAFIGGDEGDLEKGISEEFLSNLKKRMLAMPERRVGVEATACQ
ncbi:hypothetical protein SpCBS45565_g08026 [Spizellomyces sp. 'palustris']|nr:hypothetical protein SpCBS45565_g08026 [Spizellomyces sp. 'palustris']